MDTAEKIIQICKEQKIPVSTLEKACGFANAYIRKRVGGRIPSDRVKQIAEYLHVHPSELDPEMFSSEYSDPKYDGIVRRLASDKIFEEAVMELYGADSESIAELKRQFQRLHEYARRISEIPSLYYDEKKNKNAPTAG